MKKILKKRKTTDISDLIEKFNCMRIFNKSHSRMLILEEILRRVNSVIISSRQTAGDVFWGIFATDPEKKHSVKDGRISVQGSHLKLEVLIKNKEKFDIVTSDEDITTKSPAENSWREIGKIPVEKIVLLRQASCTEFQDIAITVSI